MSRVKNKALPLIFFKPVSLVRFELTCQVNVVIIFVSHTAHNCSSDTEVRMCKHTSTSKLLPQKL